MPAPAATLLLIAEDESALRLIAAWRSVAYAGNDEARLFAAWAEVGGVPLPEVYRVAPQLRAHGFVREQRLEGIERPLRTVDPDAEQLAQVRLAARIGLKRRAPPTPPPRKEPPPPRKQGAPPATKPPPPPPHRRRSGKRPK